MSVLRRAKLRTPDGTESIEYPLGVEAENVEVANQENLSQRLVRIDEDLEKNEEDIAAVSELAGTNKQNIGANEIRIDALERRSASVDKKPYYFNSVEEMKNADYLKEGDCAITLGHYQPNDGGEAKYYITSVENVEKYQINLNNTGFYAELIVYNNTVNPEQFGAYGDNIHDDFEMLKKCLNSGYNINFLANKIYKITNRLQVLKNNIKIDFNNSKINYFKTEGVACLQIKEVENVIIENLYVDCNISWVERTNDTSDFQNYTNYRNARENASGVAGIQILSSSKVSIINSHVTNSSFGIFTQYSSNVKIENCSVEYTLADAFPIYQDCHFVNIKKCRCKNNGDDGFPIWAKYEEGTIPSTSDIIIENCYAENVHARGFINHGGYRISFLNNIVRNCWIGIMVKGGPAQPSYDTALGNETIISGNYIKVYEDTKYVLYKNYGIYCEVGNNVIITNNLIHFNETPSSSEYFSILIASSYNIKINNNICHNCGVRVKHFGTIGNSKNISILNNLINVDENFDCINCKEIENLMIVENNCKGDFTPNITIEQSTESFVHNNILTNRLYLKNNNKINLTPNQEIAVFNISSGNTNVSFIGTYCPLGFDSTDTTSYVVGTMIYRSNILRILTSQGWKEISLT